MKHTKQNVIKVLTAMNELAMRIYHDTEDEDLKTMYLHESMAFDQALWLLTDKEYFDKMVEIHEVGKEKSDES